jgi:hypothetical protein
MLREKTLAIVKILRVHQQAQNSSQPPFWNLF